jgi:hypothetical protein
MKQKQLALRLKGLYYRASGSPLEVDLSRKYGIVRRVREFHQARDLPGLPDAELGGLYVIGTNRHESLRVNRQLRGRAALPVFRAVPKEAVERHLDRISLDTGRSLYIII